ncbi:hypothetical protein AAG604_10595 [Citromicrobium bathyomarinum]
MIDQLANLTSIDVALIIIVGGLTFVFVFLGIASLIARASLKRANRSATRKVSERTLKCEAEDDNVGLNAKSAQDPMNGGLFIGVNGVTVFGDQAFRAVTTGSDWIEIKAAEDRD